MEAMNTKNISNEILMEHILEMKSMIEKLQAEIQSLRNPVGDFTSNWVDTYDVMQMLRVSRRTIDNYIKAGKLTPTRINKRNYFKVSQVKALMKISEETLVKCGFDIPWLREQIKPMLEMG